ncbi:MAG: N-acetylmuramoyl-L-alanine amidase [Oscillospiraceae bacterium]|nr:N-acetylmuramoyl-L-alanine amidase [Oscillospiraceae bacterium]
MRKQNKQQLKWIYSIASGVLLFGIGAVIWIAASTSIVKDVLPFLDPGRPSTPAPVKICLDAGHGGRDPGAQAEGRSEKNDTLKIAQKVQRILEDEGVDSFMTRTYDTFVPLQERCDLANGEGATMLVSLHRNIGGGTGIEIWINSKPSEEEVLLAEGIRHELLAGTAFNDRGVKRGSYDNPSVSLKMNGSSNMTSCLVELGFMCSEEDNEIFDSQLDEIAAAIARGIIKASRMG